MNVRTYRSVASVAGWLFLLLPPSVSSAATTPRLSGEITGVVTNSSGVPQMGASVLLFDRLDRFANRVVTNAGGAFTFAGLSPDIYSLHVTLASFVPAIKDNILVQPGMRSLLNVSLATLFSTIELVPLSAKQRSLMSDDWKWVLRTSSATRPVLRLLPELGVSTTSMHHATVFSDTRGLVKVSAGDGGQAAGFGTEADLGTAFALATSLYGSNKLQLSGNLGYGAQSGIPSAAFRTSFSRAGAPTVALTMRQLYIPGRFSTALAGSDGILPALRSMSLSFADRTQLAEDLSFEYGFSLDQVSFLDRLNYFSPYARLKYALEDGAAIELTYTSGNARPDLAQPAGVSDPGLQRDLSALSLFPRVSLRGARAHVQRGENFELTYSRKIGSRTLEISGYREHVSNAALTMAAPSDLYIDTDILPDLFTGSSIFNAGNYQTLGYTASLSQNVGDYVNATLMYGSTGVLTADRKVIETDSPDELRDMIRSSRRHAVTARVSAKSPWTGTQFLASYQWADNRWAVTPGHLYSTQAVRPVPGLNLYIRQPIPALPSLPWRMEATADLRNLLAQGYLPLSLADGRRLLLMQTPRSFRGGLSFIF